MNSATIETVKVTRVRTASLLSFIAARRPPVVGARADRGRLNLNGARDRLAAAAVS
jgi:hypothetical protein